MKRVVTLLFLVGSVAAAQAPRTIAPGMSRADVVARLGAPLTTRTMDGSTYLFYANGCERRCGMHDVVVLDSDRVVDAIFRSPSRRYTGESSSPEAVPPASVRQAGARGDLTVQQAGAPRDPERPSGAAAADSAKQPAHPGSTAAPTTPAVKPQTPLSHRQTSATAPARSEIRIPMIRTPTHTRGAAEDTLRQPAQPARRQGD